MSKLHLSFLIHAHQPVGNFDKVLEQAYALAYLPFLEALEKHPAIRTGLHYSGSLLEWIERVHPEFLQRLGQLVQRGQVELVGGGFYEPILIAIPPENRIEQIRRLSEFLERRCGQRPRGAWLAERVWEPQLASALATAGVEYTLVDDVHFLAAGFSTSQLSGHYIAEDLGAKVHVFPGMQKLRYLIPFASVEENIELLRSIARDHPGGLAIMGDDNEKFGIWPGTHKHCYENGWLESYFTALEANADWLEMVTPGEWIAAHPPLGRADLPAASYSEMMEWALPTSVRQRYHDAVQEFGSRPEIAMFLRGAPWRNFFSKYAESNLLHKKMLFVSGKLRALAAQTRRGLPLRRALDDATTQLLRAQCNDAYWHGIFGGVYSPHLRTELWRSLIRAERIADAAEHGRPRYSEQASLDFDADGQPEHYLATESYSALLKPSDGATLALLESRLADAPLINSIMRRPEPYHVRLREAAHGRNAALASIHHQLRVKEPGLEKLLTYDFWPRHSFRLLLFPSWKTHADYESLRLDASPTFAASPYALESASDADVVFHLAAPLLPGAPPAASAAAPPAPMLEARKRYQFAREGDSFEVACHIELASRHSDSLRFLAGLEVIVNFLAPNEPDRYFETEAGRQALAWSGEVAPAVLRVVDEWQNLDVSLGAPEASAFWVSPIQTVSESEDGFERVYQGSQILAVWPCALEPGVKWSGTLRMRVAPARPARH